MRETSKRLNMLHSVNTSATILYTRYSKFSDKRNYPRRLISDEQYSSQLPGLEHPLHFPQSLVPHYHVFSCEAISNNQSYPRQKHLPLSRNKIPNKMRRQNQTNSIRKHKRIPLRKPWPLNSFKHQQRRPNSRRLGNDGGTYQDHSPYDWRVPKLTIHPAIQDTRHADGGVGSRECKPECGFGDFPDDQDN